MGDLPARDALPCILQVSYSILHVCSMHTLHTTGIPSQQHPRHPPCNTLFFPVYHPKILNYKCKYPKLLPQQQPDTVARFHHAPLPRPLLLLHCASHPQGDQ